MDVIGEIKVLLGGTRGDVYTLGLLELIRAGYWDNDTKYKLDRVLDLFEAECKKDPYLKEVLGAYTLLMTQLMIYFGGEEALDIVAKIEDKLANPDIIGMYDIVKHKETKEGTE